MVSLWATCCAAKRPNGDYECDVTTATTSTLDRQAAKQPSGKAFDYTKSTEDNFRVPFFIGRNKDIRPLLDYTYHVKYSEERERVQDDIIERLCAENTEERPADELLPWVIFMAGAMGVGKGYVQHWMNEHKMLDLKHFVVVDPDKIRTMLPEWDSYVKMNRESAGDMTQKEAGCIAEILGYKALRQRLNVIFDGSLRDVNWYRDYFRSLRKNFPGVRLMILHITADQDEVLRRAKERGQATGRVVPVDTLMKSMQQVPESVSGLAQYADFVCRIHNHGDQPQLQREPSAPFPPMSVPLTWAIFEDLWRTIDLNGDGQLDEHEIQIALKAGKITKEVIDSVDSNGNNAISSHELARARSRAWNSGRLPWR
mmetsp:Transcript_91558/g.259227  ORF Transcript_91558/g.259227 Transcript_91558/m.259227 type:complete len:370 (+) Transcript_91558:52-1161(+)